uniref:Innate immunity activator n=1 Tax=Corvus moneduloides TaxID=1196302 RepID=A0A8U7NC20_CORMO
MPGHSSIPHHTVLCHAVPHCTRLNHTIPCHAMPYQHEPNHGKTSHTMPCHAVPPRATPHCTFPCHPPHTIQCHAVPFHATQCRAVPYRAVPCHSIPCRAVQRSGAGTGAGVAPPAPPSAQAQTRPCPGAAEPAAAAGPGPDSPVSPPKERVQAGRRQQQALEARLDGCVQELRRLCLREAELTGTLPREYPLKAGEKPPKVRRRIGAAFKLDEIVVLRGVDPLERERALQLQIAEASRRLCHEENIDRRVRKRRQTAALREEQKLRDLEQVLIQRRLLAGQRDTSTAEELSASDESSMSDAGLLEEGEGAVGSRGDTRVPLVCSLHSNPSCVPSIPTLPVSSPSQPTQVPSIPLHCHVFPLCHSCVSLPTPHMSPLCHSPVCPFHPNPPHVPSMPTIHLFPPSQPSLCVPSIPTLHLSYRGHTATRTCHPTEVPISKGPRRGGGGVRASDGPPPLPGRRPAWTDPMRGPKMPVWTLRMGKPRAPSAILGP